MPQGAYVRLSEPLSVSEVVLISKAIRWVFMPALVLLKQFVSSSLVACLPSWASSHPRNFTNKLFNV